jgi:hypothetical protein
MTLVLLVIGLLAAAGGFVAIGFGIPINAFSLGNTLIIAGTVAAAAGLVLIGLASAVGQLRRIAEALQARPAGFLRGTESVEAILPQTARAPFPAAVPTRMPVPPKPPELHFPEPPAQEPRPAEPRLSAAASADQPAPGPLDWLRAKPKAGVTTVPPAHETMAMAGEPPMVEVPDEAPLSPRPPQRPAMPPPPPAEPALEPKAWPPARGNGSAEAKPTAPLSRATPLPPEPAKEKEAAPFDMVWPERPASTPEPARQEAVAHEPAPAPAPPRRAREEKVAERRPEPPPAKPAAERTPAILKSGVIDGMPYTLYADGSIEAELPQGVVKFASVDALRTHLEKHG